MSLDGAIQGNEAHLRALGVLFEDGTSAPPSAQVAQAYSDQLGIFEFVADTTQSIFAFFPGGSLPGILVLDTCTMEVVYQATTFDLQGILVAADGVDG